eukprot:5655922-Pyramimonas_sp.AAC.1
MVRSRCTADWHRGRSPRRATEKVLPSTAHREHQPQALQKGDVPLDQVDAQEEEEHHEGDVQRCATG